MFKKIIATFLSLSLLIGIQTCKVNAEETTDEPVIVTVEQMEYEMGPNSPFAGKYVTYGIDEQGNIIRLSVSEYQERSGLIQKNYCLDWKASCWISCINCC